jgi:alanine dehydrogenase
MSPIELTYLSGADIDALALSDDEILGAVGACLAQQGRGETVVEPRLHLFPPDAANGHFNVLRGALPGVAGVKVVGDYVDNHVLGLPSELALLLLLGPLTGAPTAILDATAITAMRTGAMTALGGQYLARRSSRVLGHIGARGSAYWNVRLLCHVLPELREIRIHSRRAESREQLAERLGRDLPSRDIHAVASWEDCIVGSDVVVEATRLTTPQPLLRTEWIAPGALVIPYGTVSAVELNLTEIMDKIVVDDWGQAGAGPLGALRAHVDSGRLSEANLHAELGEIVASVKPGREHEGETILFWHRGLSITDIALGRALLAKAASLNLGTRLPYRP